MQMKALIALLLGCMAAGSEESSLYAYTTNAHCKDVCHRIRDEGVGAERHFGAEFKGLNGTACESMCDKIFPNSGNTSDTRVVPDAYDPSGASAIN